LRQSGESICEYLKDAIEGSNKRVPLRADRPLAIDEIKIFQERWLSQSGADDRRGIRETKLAQRHRKANGKIAPVEVLHDEHNWLDKNVLNVGKDTQ
jgi:hypothetical protein